MHLYFEFCIRIYFYMYILYICLFQARIFIHIICMYTYISYLNGSYFFSILIRYLYVFVIFCLVWVYGMYERAWQDAKK